MGLPKMDVALRFERYVLPEPNSGCWLWTSAVGSTGYGLLGIDGIMTGAHRISWNLNRGAIPNGLCVLHKCDVRSCVNPDHLFLGTKGDNVRDMHAKGRAAGGSGENHGSAKLSWKDVTEIRMCNAPHSQIGRAYGVATSGITNLKNGKTWKSKPETEN